MRIIAGCFKNRQLVVPKDGVRPTSGVLKEALFNICKLQIEGAHFLDLFAGSGAVGLEALSRGAKEVTFIESAPHSLKALRKNSETLQVENSIHILGGDVLLKLKQLEKQGKSFDLIFADAPYHTKRYCAVLVSFFSQSSLLKKGGRLFIEELKQKEEPPSSERLIVKSERSFGSSMLIEYHER